MADKSLIQGAGQVYGSQGFVDYGKAYKPSNLLDAYSKILQDQEKEKQEVDAITTKVNNRMNSMNTVDLTDITFEQKTIVKDYLVDQRNIYAQAANEIAYIDDKSSSEYQYYADIMSEVNNNISNLSEQLKDYKEAKIQYEDDNDKRLWSGGVGNAVAQADAASVYGFDEDNIATLQIANGGNMQFVYSGKTVNWNDHQDPYLKHFTTAEYITGQAKTIAASNSELTAENANSIRLQLDQKLSDEQALKSLVAGDFVYEGIDLSDIVYNEEDPNSTKIEVIDRLINGFKAVGAKYKKQNLDNVSDNDVYNNTGGAFKTLGELDKGYMAMSDIQNQFLSLPSDAPRDGLNTFFNVTPNVAFRYVPPQAIEPMVKDPNSGDYVPEMVKDPKSGKMVPKKASYGQGYWMKMVRSGQAGTFKPAKLPDGSAEMFTDLRDWYMVASGQKNK